MFHHSQRIHYKNLIIFGDYVEFREVYRDYADRHKIDPISVFDRNQKNSDSKNHLTGHDQNGQIKPSHATVPLMLVRNVCNVIPLEDHHYLYMERNGGVGELSNVIMIG